MGVDSPSKLSSCSFCTRSERQKLYAAISEASLDDILSSEGYLRLKS